MGQTTRYQKNPEILKKLSGRLRAGATRADAASGAGIDEQTLQAWLRRDDGVVLACVESAEAWAREHGVRPAARDREPSKKKTVDPWEKMRGEAGALGPGLFGVLLWVDGLLVLRGYPPISPWWRWALGSFYESAKRWLVLMVGRRGGKSSTLCRVAVVEALFGEREITPGDVGVWPVFSVDMAEARGRLTMIKTILDVLGVEYSESTMQGRPRIVTQDAKGRPIEFRVYPATVKGASGMTATGTTADEMAKWEDEETGANPAREVLRSVRPAMATIKAAHGFICSSAWAKSGVHYEMVTAGSTKLNHVARIGEQFIDAVKAGFYAVAANELEPSDAAAIRAHADSLTADSTEVPSFLANPTLDPQETRDDEPDLATWLREYGSVPLGLTGSTFFDGPKLDAAAAQIAPVGDGPCFCAIDPGSRRNAASCVIVQRRETAEGVRYPTVYEREWIPAPGAPLDLRKVVFPAMAKEARARGCAGWVTDVHALTDAEIVGAEYGLSTRCRAEGDAFRLEYQPVRDALHRGELPLGASPEIVKQLRTVKSAPRDGGGTRMIIPADGDLHGDLGRAYVSACAEAGAGAAEETGDDDFESLPSRYAGAA